MFSILFQEYKTNTRYYLIILTNIIFYNFYLTNTYFNMFVWDTQAPNSQIIMIL